MLVNLLSDATLRQRFDVSLSYRHSQRYVEGLNGRLVLDFPTYPQGYRDPTELLRLTRRTPPMLARIARALAYRLAEFPLLIQQTWSLWRLFSRLRPDLLHINNGGYPGSLSARAAAIAGRLSGVPSILMVINNLAVPYNSPGRLSEFFVDRLVARSVTRFLSGSRAAAARVRMVLRLRDSRCQALPNGADLRETTETVDGTRARLGLSQFVGTLFGIVALMEHRKGHRVLLEALAQLAADGLVSPTTCKVVFLGDGHLRAELEAFASENDLDDYCLFLGEEANAMNVIAALDVLVLSSVEHEDFPNVILEAMGAGKPVVSSRIAGTPEQVVEGCTGYLVDAGDASQLAERMSLLVHDAPLRAAMGAAARRVFAEQFTAEAAARRYVTVYEEMIGDAMHVAPSVTYAFGADARRQ